MKTLITRTILVMCVLGSAERAWAGREQSALVPKLVAPAKVLSLHRASDKWKVVTTVVLGIEPTTHEATRIFKWSDPAHGEFACDGQAKTVHEIEKPIGTTSISCTYQPSVGYEGADVLKYTARFGGGSFAEEVEVSIDVRARGFRWEFKTNAATVTSDAPDPDALKQIPDIIGGTAQDFLFTLNWQTSRPKTPLATAPSADATRLLRQADLQTTDITAARSANFLFETGVQTDVVAATVVEVGSSATTAASGTTTATSEQAVARRNMVLRGEFNLNASFNADGVGRFVEFGLLGKSSFSTVLDSDESFKEAAGRVLQVVAKDRSAVKFDAGVRLAIKQPHELNTTTIVNPKGQIEQPTNIENMLLVEFTLYRFDSAMSDLETAELDGDSRKRWAVKAEFSPEITALPGHQLPTIGVEISKSWAGGPPAVKVTYGVNLSATKGIFK